MIKIDIAMGNGTVALGAGHRTVKGQIIDYFISFQELMTAGNVGDVVTDRLVTDNYIRLLVKDKEALISLRGSMNNVIDELQGVIEENDRTIKKIATADKQI